MVSSLPGPAVAEQPVADMISFDSGFISYEHLAAGQHQGGIVHLEVAGETGLKCVHTAIQTVIMKSPPGQAPDAKIATQSEYRRRVLPGDIVDDCFCRRLPYPGDHRGAGFDDSGFFRGDLADGRAKVIAVLQ